MKYLIAALILLFLILQCQLWFASNGFLSAVRMRQRIADQKQINTQLEAKNVQLKADIAALKKDQQVLEDRARNEYGMIKKGETFYQIVDTDQEKHGQKNT